MASFILTPNPTAFGYFDTEVDFQDQADKMVKFVKAKLGDDVLSVELSSRQIWYCFEEATLEWGAIINEYHAKSTMANLLGQSTGSVVQNKYPRESLEFLLRQAEPYAMAASYAGYQTELSGAIELNVGQQDYNLRTDLVIPDGANSGSLLFDMVPSGSSGGRPRVTEVFHFSPASAYRFFDSTSAINFLNNEFSFESFTPETLFYVLPVFEDLLRVGQLQLSQRVRRSNYSYKIVGHTIRIFPIPRVVGGNGPGRLWIRVQFPPNPLDPGFEDPSISGISTLSNIPYGNILFNTINDVGRHWIREYTLSLCMILLAFIRGKVKSGIPVGNQDVQLNSDDLLQKGYEDKDRLRTQLREMLESMTYDKLVEQSALKSENLMKQLRGVPFPNGYMIVPG